MVFYLLFCLLCIPFNMVYGASLALNTMPKAYQGMQKSSLSNTTTKEPEIESLNDDNDNLEETEFDEADEFDDLDFKPSLRTKIVRALRSVKQYSSIIIAGATICTLTYLYWYKIWPFSTNAVANNTVTNVQNDPINNNNESSTCKKDVIAEPNLDMHETNQKEFVTEHPEPKFNFQEIIPINKKNDSNDSLQKLKDKIAKAKTEYASPNSRLRLQG